MAFSRRLGVVAIVGTSWLVAIGCDDSDDQVPQQSAAGEGGEAPTAGKASVAGSQNNGGKAGGGAGTAGTAGKASGGSTGEGGGGGDAGHGQTSAGQAGTGGETAGAAGIGGAGGEGGSPAAAIAASCSFTCANDDDCLIGQNDSQKCNLVSHRCEDPAAVCTNDVDCLISQSGFFFTCVDDSECDPDYEACVDAGGQGYCATLPDPDCFGPDPKQMPRFGAVGTVDVCASIDPRCIAGACIHGCGENGCGQGNGDTCSATTGLCECAQGTECTKTNICGGDGHCQQCAIDDDCAATVGTTGLGICVDGTCGCANPTTCINPGYASATAACQ